ncbi:MAG: polysaccharide biosynthesis tyrosine autokinase [Deltaproteobacteria bacterium]|nr:polysaccharide biosynthesis tyrosine autokinase [Deltaproteobacteria bacterium]
MPPPHAWTKGDIRYYLDILYQRRLLVAVVFAVTMVMLVIAYIVTPPEYTARAKLLIEPEQYASVNAGDMGQGLQSYYFQTQLELMRSEPVLRLAARGLGTGEGTKAFDAVIGKLDRGLTVERVPDSRIFIISMKSHSPAFSAGAANAVAASYIRFLDEERKKRISDVTLWLQGELTSLKNKVEKSEMKLIRYVEEQSADSSGDSVEFLGSPDDNAASKALSELETKYTSLQIKLTNMLQKYKDKYPSVVQLRNDIQALRTRIGIMKQDMLEANKRRIQYIMLSRDVELSKDLYSMLTKELKEVNVFGEIGYPTATIIEHAAAPSGRSNRGFMFWLLFGLMVSSVTGVVAALIADQLDSSIKGELDVERFIGYPVIGTLPFLEEIKLGEPQKLIGILNSASSQAYTEALRLIRTNLKYSFVKRSSKVLLVTSAGENEGKTTISASLAYFLSLTGSKVLLLDADVKKPSVHKLFNSEKVPGYTELLVDEKPADAIKQSSHGPLYYLTSGRQPPNFAELIDSSRSKEFIEMLRGKFDYVIIDSPPVGIISDAAILSSQVDGVIFVVKANGYPREQVVRSIGALSAINAKIAGIVLTHLDKGKGYYRDYYYSKGYYHEEQ